MMRRDLAALKACALAALTGGGIWAEAAGAKPAVAIVCTTFPVYQFTRGVALGREGTSVSLLLSAGLGCPHDYVVTPDDLKRLAAADVLVINGLGMEDWLDAALRTAGAKIAVVDASEGLPGVLWDAPGEACHGRCEHVHANPHLFASPAMAVGMVSNIAAGLSRADPGGAAIYAERAAAVSGALSRLAADAAAAGRDLTLRKVAAQHAVFDYLARDLGLEVVALLQEHAGQEPSASEMLALARRLKSVGASAILTEPQYPDDVARTLSQESGVPVLAMDPVASGPDDAPLDYYEKTMRANLDRLRRALGGR